MTHLSKPKSVFFMLYMCLLINYIVDVGGESIVANVTKSVPEKKANVTKDQTVSPKLTTRSEIALKTDFSPPRAISINAGDNNEAGYTMFPLPPPSFHFPGDDGLEETFTYQVKKQRQPANDPLGLHDEFNLIQQRAKRESIEAMQFFVNELNKDMDEKIDNISRSVTNLSNGMVGNISAVTSAWDQLNYDVWNLTKLSKETSRMVKVLQFTHEQAVSENSALREQINNLTSEIASLRHERAEDIARISTALAGLQTKLDNSTHEVRIHEAHLRYGQQVMSSIRESVDQNVERITGLERDGGPQWIEQTTGCGGVVVANAGMISYKFRQPYKNNERCVWIIRANRKAQINLQIMEDGFQNQSNSDFLTVTEFADDQQYQHPVTLITSSRLEHGNNALHTFQSSVIFVTFYSDATVPGTGFALKFEGVGNRSDAANVNAIRHLNLHFSSPIGNYRYPTDESVTYQPNELVTLAINPIKTSTLKIFMKSSDLEKDEHCEFDSISFYGSVTGSYALTKRYCQHGENFTGEIIQSSDGIFLVVFRSDASTQFSGFQFSWEID